MILGQHWAHEGFGSGWRELELAQSTPDNSAAARLGMGTCQSAADPARAALGSSAGRAASCLQQCVFFLIQKSAVQFHSQLL